MRFSCTLIMLMMNINLKLNNLIKVKSLRFRHFPSNAECWSFTFILHQVLTIYISIYLFFYYLRNLYLILLNLLWIWSNCLSPQFSIPQISFLQAGWGEVSINQCKCLNWAPRWHSTRIYCWRNFALFSYLEHDIAGGCKLLGESFACPRDEGGDKTEPKMRVNASLHQKFADALHRSVQADHNVRRSSSARGSFGCVPGVQRHGPELSKWSELEGWGRNRGGGLCVLRLGASNGTMS